MRKLVFLILCVLSAGFIFFPSESLCWWWQRPKSETLETHRSKPAQGQAEEKLIQAINQRLKQQTEELLAQNRTLVEKNEILQTELNQISRDRRDLLKKLKDYTVHRERLEARVRVLEVGIVSLNEIKKELVETNKALSEQVGALKKELKPVRKVRKEFKEKIAECKERYKSSKEKLPSKLRKEREKHQKQLDKLNIAIKDLKKARKTYVEQNKGIRHDLKSALSELSDSNAKLEKGEYIRSSLLF